jgi:hypothetical protein
MQKYLVVLDEKSVDLPQAEEPRCSLLSEIDVTPKVQQGDPRIIVQNP